MTMIQPATIYEVRESSGARPECSTLLRNANTDGSPLSFAQAMRIASEYNARGQWNVYISIIRK